MIILDIETTGNEYAKHSIVQIAALEFERPENRYVAECRIWDGAEILPLSLEYNGWNERSLRDPNKPSDIDIADGFVRWAQSVGEKTMVGENPAFDRDFLVYTLRRNKKKWPFGFRTIDIHTVSTLHHLQRKREIPREDGVSMLRLDETLKYVGLPEEEKPHAALRGMLLEAEAFSRLVYGKNLLSEFAQYSIPQHCL